MVAGSGGAHTAIILASALDFCSASDLGACRSAAFLGKDTAHPACLCKGKSVLEWIISLSIAAGFAALGVHANSKLGTIRKDERPHLVPWGLVMVGCVFAVFLVVVHLFNIVGIETGPEHGPFGRF